MCHHKPPLCIWHDSLCATDIGTNVGIQLDAWSNCSTGPVLAVGCRMKLECYPPNAYPKNITVSWYRNGQALTAAELGLEYSSAMRVLVIASPTYADSGSYQCMAGNGLGIIRRSMLIHVTVQGHTNEPGMITIAKSIIYR